MAKHRCTAKSVVDSILDRPIGWVDWRSLPLEARKTWGADAKALLNNQVFQSICGKSELINQNGATNGEYVKMCIENIARGSKNHQETENIRMIINTCERIREMIEESVFVETRQTQENLNAPI